MYALVDSNNFYASCERVFDPSLIEKPVAILSNNDACVIARSEEAKAAGVKMGGPASPCMGSTFRIDDALLLLIIAHFILAHGHGVYHRKQLLRFQWLILPQLFGAVLADENNRKGIEIGMIYLLSKSSDRNYHQ